MPTRVNGNAVAFLIQRITVLEAFGTDPSQGRIYKPNEIINSLMANENDQSDEFEVIDEQQKKPQQNTQEQGFVRVRMPRGNQVLAFNEQRLGGSRMRCRCFDGKTRICRIPGRLKRRLWIREGDILLVEPWEIGGDAKGDVIYKYRPNQVKVLEKKGLLENLNDENEF